VVKGLRVLRHAIAALGLLAVAGCATATASPSSPTSAEPTIREMPPLTPTPTPALAAGASLELNPGRLPVEVTGKYLEVASDGWSIWYSAPGPGETESAPDLYRYEPGAERPELIWRNPERDRSLVKIAGEGDVIGFADLNITPGVRSWRMWLMPAVDADPILLDEYPGGVIVPGAVPSFAVDEGRIVWTAFDEGPTEPVSEMWVAEGPDWKPRRLMTEIADDVELWLPSLFEDRVAFVRVTFSEDRATNVREILVIDLARPDDPPLRMDADETASNPLIDEHGVTWKETDPGFSMFNGGRLNRFEFETGEVIPIRMGTDEVNYPSVGDRYVTAWPVDISQFYVYDLELGRTEAIARYPRTGPEGVVRPSLRGDLLVWQYVNLDRDGPPELRWAYLPVRGSSR
jgi:hypothetical protein